MNTISAYLAVFVGGGLGSLLRYIISIGGSRYFTSDYPWGTFISNTLATLVLAILLIAGGSIFIKNDTWRLFAVVGFCGGFSTFSTFSFETFELFRTGNYFIAILNIVLSISVCLFLVWMMMQTVKSH